MSEMRPAGGFSRFLAALVDGFFMSIVVVILMMGLGLTQELNR